MTIRQDRVANGICCRRVGMRCLLPESMSTGHVYERRAPGSFFSSSFFGGGGGVPGVRL